MFVAELEPDKNQLQIKWGLNVYIAESGFETCFCWDCWDPAPQVLGSDNKNKSRIKMLRPFGKIL